MEEESLYNMKTFYVGIKGIVVRNGKSLILKRESDIGNLFWDLPGGRMNEGEDIKEALVRELYEEAIPSEFPIEVGKLLHVWKLDRDLQNGQGLFLLYYRVYVDIEKPVLSAEHIGYEWISEGDLHKDSFQGIPLEKGLREALKIALNT